MKQKKPNEILKIHFYNPNTSEETAKHLAKVIAQNIANQVIQQKLHTE